MKNRFLILLAIPAVLITVFAYELYEQHNDKDKVLIELISSSLRQVHYNPKNVNDDFSEDVFDLYIQRLDYGKRYFLQSDIERLETYRYEIDDQIGNRQFDFFDLSTTILEERFDDVNGFYQEILNQPFDFTIDESIEIDHENLEYAKTKEELRERWRKILKYQTMIRLDNLLNEQEQAAENEDNDTLEIKPVEVLEKEAREKVLKSYNDMFSRLDQLNEDDHRSIYFNSITNIFDPHSEYYPPIDKENFDIAMSGQLEGIGATLQQQDGYVKIVRIVPGSPSWKQGDLEAGDLILKVAQGADDPVDVVDMRLDDAVQLIRGPKGTEVRLTVKKIDGSITIIPIIRDVVILEETYAKSAIVEDGETRIGYINLPKFYADFDQPNGRRSAVDVAQEVEKLKTENVQGLVLDLRNNGGGSLRDVVEIMGLFIEKGPVVQVKLRGRQPTILSDQDDRLQYDGPLVVLVNHFSASASEILAAAVQDYHRGIIIGSTQTFGKGTVQQFYDLDAFISHEFAEFKPLGALKITTQKFYRVNGDATQLKGVEPDIVLNDQYSYLEIGENEQDYPLPFDEIEAANFISFDNNYNLSKIERNSTRRLNSNELFQLIEENAQRIKEQNEKTSYSLNLEVFRAEQKRLQEVAEKYESIDETPTGLNILKLQEQINETDTAKVERMKAWHEKLEKDIYLLEAVNVIEDIMNQ